MIVELYESQAAFEEHAQVNLAAEISRRFAWPYMYMPYAQCVRLMPIWWVVWMMYATGECDVFPGGTLSYRLHVIGGGAMFTFLTVPVQLRMWQFVLQVYLETSSQKLEKLLLSLYSIVISFILGLQGIALQYMFSESIYHKAMFAGANILLCLGFYTLPDALSKRRVGQLTDCHTTATAMAGSPMARKKADAPAQGSEPTSSESFRETGHFKLSPCIPLDINRLDNAIDVFVETPKATPEATTPSMQGSISMVDARLHLALEALVKI
jgi:hypothetical protein